MAADYPKLKIGEIAASVSETHKRGKPELIFLNTSDILHGKFLHRTYTPTKDWPGQAKKSISRDDILLSEIRPANGRWAFVREDADDFVVSTKLMVIRADQRRVCPLYLYQFLTSSETTAWLQHLAESRSGTFPQITFDQVASLEIPLPPLPEQKAIAQILGTLDDKIELNRRMNATLEAMARALFQRWMETHETEIEQHSVQSLIDTRTLLIGDGYRAKNSEMGSGGLPFVRAGNLREDGLDLSGAETLGPEGVKAAGHKLGQAGDVAFTSKGTVGRITRVAPKTGRFVYSPQVCFWRSLVPEKLHPNVLYRWMSTDGFMRQVDAVSRQTDMAPYVSLQDQRKMVIQLPPAAAQQTIAKQLQPIDEKIAADAEQSRTLATLRDTLLPKLLSGELSTATAA